MEKSKIIGMCMNQNDKQSIQNTYKFSESGNIERIKIELLLQATVKNFLTVQQEGKRRVK